MLTLPRLRQQVSLTENFPHGYDMPVFYLIAVLFFSLFTPSSLADEPRLTLGTGVYGMKLQHSPQGLPNNDFGVSVFAEHTQNNYAGSRFVMYNIDDDEVSAYGAEFQLLLGYGLTHNGLRIYTGPTWHIEHIHLPRANTTISHTFKGWAWQVGTGLQYKAISIDYAFGLRANQAYKNENRRLGNPGGNMHTHSILLGYRF